MPTNADSSVISARALRKTYRSGTNSVVALDSVDIDIDKAEMTAIMGPSGSGKSTLMHLLAALDEPTSGSIRFGEVDMTHLGDSARTLLRRRQIGFVFQAFNLVPTLDVMGNILLPFELDGQSGADARGAWIEELVADLGLSALVHRRPSELSGGQQQRVAIVRALAMQPTVIFADEPTGALDSRNGREVLDLLASASRSRGQTVVLVTHDPVAASRADRVLFLADGRITRDVRAATAEELSELAMGNEARR